MILSIGETYPKGNTFIPNLLIMSLFVYMGRYPLYTLLSFLVGMPSEYERKGATATLILEIVACISLGLVCAIIVKAWMDWVSTLIVGWA